MDLEDCRKLLLATKNDVPSWSIPLPNITWGKIKTIKDGDTFVVYAPVWPAGELKAFTIRLAGIQCPEITAKKSISDLELQMGYEVTFIVKYKWAKAMVRIEPLQYDLYGRLLARLFDETGVCINDWLLAEHLACPSDGKKKITGFDWQKYRQSKTLPTK